MAGTEVSSVIRDIINAFHTGLSALKRPGRRHKRRSSEPVNAHDERRMHDSLTYRPNEIRQAYDSAVVKHGRKFEVGDEHSQTSLAQILLRLNTGLLRLLNHALSNDKHSRSQSRHGLYNLSEAAAIDTLSALSELNIRLSSATKITAGLPALQEESSQDRGPKYKSRPRAQSCNSAGKRPPPTPLLHTGGWVRSKTDPSVVSVVVSNRARRPEARRASTSRPHSGTSPRGSADLTHNKAERRKSPPPKYSRAPEGTAADVEPKTECLQTKTGRLPTIAEPNSKRQTARTPSMYIVPSDFFDIFPQPQVTRCEPQAAYVLPSLPPMVPLHSRPDQPQDIVQDNVQVMAASRQGGMARPTSMMTFMTASTKIGEIPEHRLPDRNLTEEQQESIPMPYVVPDMLEPQKRKTGRGLKFWRKERQDGHAVQASAA